MTLARGEFFSKSFPWSWIYSINQFIVQDTTDERNLKEHLGFHAKYLPLPKGLIAFK